MEAPLAGREEVPDRLENALAQQRSTILKASRNRVDPVRDFARSVAAGLAQDPPRLECRFLYDARGSALYEEITRQPEYYLTRTEAAILARRAPRIRELTGPVTLLELGSGSSVKTDHLLRAYREGDEALCYIPIDVSDSALRQAAQTIGERHPGVQVIGIHGTYENAFPLLRAASPVMIIFLGSTIGNFDEEESDRFLTRLSRHLDDGDFFLLGVDLVKDIRILEAAYNDAAGVTEAFTRNLFLRMNRELGSGLDVAAVEHLARYAQERERIEIDARFTRAQRIRVAPLGRTFDIAAGEKIRTEISCKFRLETLRPRLETFGFTTRRIFTDERQWFALLLLQKTGETSPEPQKNRISPPTRRTRRTQPGD